LYLHCAPQNSIQTPGLVIGRNDLNASPAPKCLSHGIFLTIGAEDTLMHVTACNGNDFLTSLFYFHEDLTWPVTFHERAAAACKKKPEFYLNITIP